MKTHLIGTKSFVDPLLVPPPMADEAAHVAAQVESDPAVVVAPSEACDATPRLIDHFAPRYSNAEVMRVANRKTLKLQRQWTRELETHRLGLFLANLDRPREADEPLADRNRRKCHALRMRACGQKHASSYLSMTPGTGEVHRFDYWLPTAEFLALVRQRLYLPHRSEPVECPLCHKKEADIYGEHVLMCLGGGDRHRLSNAIREIIADVLRGAGCTVATEAKCFRDSNMRMDVLAVTKGQRYAVDVAITHDYMNNTDTYGRNVKVRKYGHLCEIEGNMEMIPMVGDTMGGWGEVTLGFVGKWSKRFANTCGIVPQRANIAVFAWLNNTIARGVARVLLQLVTAAARSDDNDPFVRLDT
jgi:hypothetical protein